MTADAHTAQPARPGRTPGAIRAALSGADRSEFEHAYQAAVDKAAADYDLTPLYDVLDRWWQVAVLTADPTAHRRMLDMAAALRAGGPVESVPWSTVRADLGI